MHYVVTVHLTTHTWNVTSSLKISFSANLSSSSRCWKSTQKWKWRLWSWGFSTCNSCSQYPLTWRHLCRMRQTLDWGIWNSWLLQCVDFWGLLTNVSRTCSTVSEDGPSRPVRFAVHRQPLCWNFTYHSLIVLSVHGSVWYMVQNIHCTIKIDSVFGKFQDTECCLIPCPRHVSSRKKKTGEIIHLMICSFLLCLSWLLHSRVWKFWKDLWITLYFTKCNWQR